MKFDTILKDLDGTDAVSEDKPVTLGRMCCLVLNAGIDGPPDEKLRRCRLLLRINAAEQDRTDIPLPAEDVALLKKCLLAAAVPLMAARALEIIDPDSLK
jgi:hypothetical protein